MPGVSIRASTAAKTAKCESSEKSGGKGEPMQRKKRSKQPAISAAPAEKYGAQSKRIRPSSSGEWSLDPNQSISLKKLVFTLTEFIHFLEKVVTYLNLWPTSLKQCEQAIL